MPANTHKHASRYLRWFALVLAAMASPVLSANDLPQLTPQKVLVPMADGTRLSADIYKPEEAGSFPAIVMRTPYSATSGSSWAVPFIREFVQANFVVVLQDCRGTGNSEGEWAPLINERRDGEETLQWVLDQEWCNQKVASFGGSYLGYTQWAAAPGGGEQLAAMFSMVPALRWYDVCYEGGAYRLEMSRVWSAMMARPKFGQEQFVTIQQLGGMGQRVFTFRNGDWDAVLRDLPLRTWGERFNIDIPWDQAVMAHPDFGAYWKPLDATDRTEEIAAPILTITGWHDQFLNQILAYAPEVRRSAATEAARRHHHLVIGPWGHYLTPVGQRQHGDNANVDVVKLASDWFAHWLTEQDSGVRDWPLVRIYVMGSNVWRDEREWPLARTNFTRYYFHSGGKANTLDGDGHLSTTPPKVEEPDSFLYDPNDPVPTHGGTTSFLTASGSLDQREVEHRDDVLVYTSNALEGSLEVTGPVRVVLYAATDGRDTDWTAKLVDVHPDGTAYNLCDGIVRARYRTSRAKATLLTPGEVCRYEIDLWATSNVFQPGHRIRVEISSSNFPRFDRNPNTGNAFGVDRELRIAHQTVYHDAEHPSHILLPVIPR